jgi:general secretion pathway protein D
MPLSRRKSAHPDLLFSCMTLCALRLGRLFASLLVTAFALHAQPPVESSVPITEAPSATAQPANAPSIKSQTSATLSVSGDPDAPMPGEFRFTDMPLSVLVAAGGPLTELTERSVLFQQGLPNPAITVTFKTAPTRAEALQAIETSLNLNGIALVPLGEKFLKVVPLANVRTEAAPFIEGSTLALPPSGQIAAKLFQLQFLRVAEFVPQINTILNNNLGGFTLFEKANATLIIDSVSTLQRVEMLVEKVDRPVTAGIATKFYTLQFAKASDLVNKLRTFLQGPLQQQLSSITSYNADDRTNQIIVISDPRQFTLFDELIAKLDVKADPNTRNEVIYLKHAAAKDVATLLSTLITGQTRATQGGNSIRPGQIVRGPTTPNGDPSNPVQAVGPLIDVGAPSNEFSSLVNIQPDERSNAVVVSGTVDDIRLIKELVEKIDIILSQVRIEVVIVEVVLSDSASSGISSLGLNVQNGKLVGFNTSAAGVAIGGSAREPTTDNPNPSSGFATFGRDFDFKNLDLTGVISLTTSPRKNNSTVLSVPSITTMHNKEGEIFVGETRPVVSGITTVPTGATDSGLSTSSQVTQLEIGTKVSVKPLIGYDGTVQLEIKQEISTVTGFVTLDNNEQPIVGKRTSESFLTVKSGEIIVLGGIQTNSKSRNTNRLGPIPIIGDLLGNRRRDDSRTELVFFIRPTVLANTPADNAEALSRLENLPKKTRDDAKKLLSGPAEAVAHPAAAATQPTHSLPPSPIAEPTPPPSEADRAKGPALKRPK